MNTFLSRLKINWKSGLTVSLVSIPLSVSLAVASHASPVTGIVTAVYAGIVAALFGGSHFNIVGPTGALSGILATFAITHGAEMLPMLALLSGALIMLAYFLKLERYLVFVPGGAIHGFTLGVAFIIGLNQLNFALGLTGLPVHEKFVENVLESLKNVAAASPTSLCIFTIALAFLLVWKRLFPKLPGAIIVAPIGIVVGLLAANNALPFAVNTLDSLYPTMDFSLLLPHPFTFKGAYILPAFAVALVSIIETMLSAKIADGMTKTKHHKQKEMQGLAFANILSGLVGGMPATAALARTSLNIKTGATNRLSGIISSIAVAVISLFFLSYFKFIPLAVIAAILVYVAIQMIEVHHFLNMWELDKKNFFVSILVAVITIFEDPIVGILFGVAISSLLLLEKLSRGQFDLVLNSNKKMTGHMSGETIQNVVKKSDTILYSFEGMLCYINSESHIERFHKNLNGAKHVILRFRSVYYIDLDGVEAIDEIVHLIESQGKDVYLTSLNPIVAEMLIESPVYQKLKRQHRVFKKSADVLKYLGFKLP